MIKRMLTMDKIKYITSIRQFEGLTLREISRKTGYHFNTVKNTSTLKIGTVNLTKRTRDPQSLTHSNRLLMNG